MKRKNEGLGLTNTDSLYFKLSIIRKCGMMKTAMCFQLTCTTIYYMFLVFGGSFFSRNDIHHSPMQKAEPNIVGVKPRGMLSCHSVAVDCISISFCP